MTNGSEERATAVNEAEIDHRVSARTGQERFRTRIEVRGHVFSADEPAALGGTDLGPTPYDLLCAALGACTTITLRMYADRKGWALAEVEAKVEHSRRPPPEGSPAADPRDHFSIALRVEGELDREQRARLLEIASRCPVHKTLVRGGTVDVIPS